MVGGIGSVGGIVNPDCTWVGVGVRSQHPQLEERAGCRDSCFLGEAVGDRVGGDKVCVCVCVCYSEKLNGYQNNQTAGKIVVVVEVKVVIVVVVIVGVLVVIVIVI